MAKSLVIVESPSKAKTINKYLGKDFVVEATVGHIKDLPKSKMNVDLENDYEGTFAVIPGKENIINNLRKIASSSSKVYIATDPDREGEAIASDIADEVVLDKKKIHRVLFNEITKTGVEQAMDNARKIDENLVSAQVARRVMDRILGYKVSPFLWKTFYFGLSAGRVQSVALKIICEREDEIEKFKPKEYWTVEGMFSKPSGNSKAFSAKLYKINDDTLKFDGEDPCIRDIEHAHKILQELRDNKYKITDITVKEVKRNAPAPFTTSVLQQTASTRLGFSPKKTMMLAQKLYEGIEGNKEEGLVGLITYMRTDSTRVSNEAITSARDFIDANFGKEFLPAKPKEFKSKKKNTQDAHEAIRPTDVNRRPEDMKKLGKDLHLLYDLIWKRFVASQMSQAVLDQKTVIIRALSPRGDKNVYLFKATGSVMKFSGFLKVYEDVKEDTTDNTGNEIDEDDLTLIPADLNVEDFVKVLNLSKDQHFTNPPPRYTESSLIKQLDKLGIGRPSTFAAIVSTVINRMYVEVNEKKLFATNLGRAVNKVLSEHFDDVINVNFTARMEEELDTIANGNNSYKTVLDEFYLPFNKDLTEADAIAAQIKKGLVEKTDIPCPECGAETGAKMEKKWSRNGQFLSCENFPKCKGALPLMQPTEKDLEMAKGVICDKCGAPMQIKVGRYGKFYGCTNYPKCNGIKPITLGIKCPKCNEGEILQRKAKGGRFFYGCTKYPDCDFITSSMPVMQDCTACGNNYLVKKNTKKDGDFLECPKCKERYELKEEKQAEEVNN
ncbi:MAG TPA: type I DNA topoisomerase [Ignavibacteria bacterium]|nr:type I DNA topoisomerase [Ignavibacteria bacterium]HMR38991.1 type I DNA topoisomerase [Ignavibacteria bacterium]